MAAVYRLSDHYGGKRFKHPWPVKKMDWRAGATFYPKIVRDHPYHRIEVTQVQPVRRVSANKMRVTWVGHSTLLVQMEGVNILTDPVWSDRVGPIPWLSAPRCAFPAIRFEDLPTIDVVLISHNHYDHLDKPTIQRLAARERSPLFFVPLGNGPLLARWGVDRVKIVEKDWWDSFLFNEHLIIHCLPAQHFSGRTLWGMNRSLWCSWSVAGFFGSFYFVGDSGYFPGFKEIGKKMREIFSEYRLPEERFSLAAIPIGAYEPWSFMEPVHLRASQAVQVHEDLEAKQSMAIHFQTFKLGLEGYDDPPKELERTLRGKDLPDETFWLPSHGASRRIY